MIPNYINLSNRPMAELVRIIPHDFTGNVTSFSPVCRF